MSSGFDNPDWSIQRVQIVCTLVCADTLLLSKETRIWRATNAKTIAAALVLSTNIMRKNIVYNALCIMHCV